MSLHVKPPLRNKIPKNNVFFRVKSVRCRQIVIVLRAVYIDAVLLLSCFYFLGHTILFLRPKCKIKCRNGGRRGGL